MTRKPSRAALSDANPFQTTRIQKRRRKRRGWFERVFLSFTIDMVREQGARGFVGCAMSVQWQCERAWREGYTCGTGNQGDCTRGLK